ncbi:MAG: histidine--tRNA ligase [Pseudomonadota bacterium]
MSERKTLQAARGMQDWTGPAARELQALERRLMAVFEQFSYEPLRLPMLESVALFKRGVGEATDIVEKEMFLIEPRHEEARDQLALRPEGTASTVRALQQQGLLFNQHQRVYYCGSMFRYERPQKGRYREFYQLGAEAFGYAGPDLDAELIALAAQCWRELGIDGQVRLQLNNIGSAADRRAFGGALVRYLESRAAELDADSQRRLSSNPLRILDSKHEATQSLLLEAPRLEEFVSAASQDRFAQLQELLGDLGIEHEVNERLVRGLDYYNDTVLEWVTDALGAQGTVCAGGRYDSLVEQLGGRATPGAGFAIGLERVLLLCQAQDGALGDAAVDAYLCVVGEAQRAPALALAQALREALPALKLRSHLGGGKLDKQLKRADASGAAIALILGPAEADAQQVQYKPLRGGSAQSLGLEALVQQLREDGYGQR